MVNIESVLVNKVIYDLIKELPSQKMQEELYSSIFENVFNQVEPVFKCETTRLMYENIKSIIDKNIEKHQASKIFGAMGGARIGNQNARKTTVSN